MTSTAEKERPTRLPPLREDLVLGDGAKGAGGNRTWQIYDPLRHRYISIDDETRRALVAWPRHETVASLAKALGHRGTEEVQRLVTFLERSGLLIDLDTEWRKRFEAEQAAHSNPLMRLVHGYLFFRLPLFSPEGFLDATRRAVAPLFTRTVQLVIALIGLLGLYFVSRQWEVFLGEARHLLTPIGMAQFGIVLFVVKIIHEMAHAYTARRYGCRVPTMGIAVMMMAPMLYTDVSDAWRLTDRRKRIAIDSAGVAAELMLAGLATFLWAFLPEGTARHVCFLVATTSWLMSVAINLNPFMRFDGYYIAAELLGVDNLQSRAFDFGVWRLREVLFALGAPPPEDVPRRVALQLTIYAWLVWVYRLFMFIGIAVAVYYCFFKALGVALFLFEIAFFVARPVAAELTVWWTLHAGIRRSRRSLVTLGLAAACIAAVVVPWPSRVAAPAVLEVDNLARLYAPRHAYIKSVHVRQGQRVARGDVLLTLDAPDLRSDRRVAAARLATVDLRLARGSADQEDRNERQVLLGTRSALTSRLAGIDRELAELVLRAPIDGEIREMDTAVHAGRWIGPREAIAMLVGGGALRITGYLQERDVWRIHAGAHATFVPEAAGAARVSAALGAVPAANSKRVEQPELVMAHGGSIETVGDGQGAARLTPASAVYPVMLTAPAGDRSPPPMQRLRGTVHIEAQGESYLAAVWRHILKVIVRESSA